MDNMKYIKLFEDITGQDNINIDEVIELLIDLEDKEITLEKSNDYLVIGNINGKVSIVNILDRISDVLTQFDDFEIKSIDAFFSKKYKGWTSKSKYKFLKEYDYHTYDFLMKNYEYARVASIKDIKKYQAFTDVDYDELYILFQRKNNKGFLRRIKSFFKK